MTEQVLTAVGTQIVGPDGVTHVLPGPDLGAFRAPAEDESASAASRMFNEKSAELTDVPGDVELHECLQEELGYLPQGGPTTVPAFVDFGVRSV